MLALCWCLHLEFNFEETFPLSEKALAILEDPELSPDLAEYERQFMLGEAHLILSQVLYFMGEFEQGLACVEKALAQISPAFSYGLSGAWYYWLEFNQVLGRRDEAIERIHKVIRDYPVNSPFTMNIHLGLCYVYRSAADFPRLSKAGRAFLKAAQKANLPESVAFAHFHLGVLHYEWNELEKARHHFEAAINLRYFAHALSYQGSLQGLSLVLLAQDQPNGFQDTMAMMNEFARQTESDFLLTCNRSFQARLSLLEGDLVRANRMSLADYDTPQVEPMVEYEVPALTRAKVLAQSNTQESLQQANLLLEELLDHAESTHITWRQIEILALQALVLEAQDRNEQALSRLKQAVALAKLGWLVRTFVDLGPSLAKLLRQLAVRNIESDYLSHVLKAFNSESNASLPKQDSKPRLATPLTEREREVLFLLAQRLTNQEIAQRLIVSPKTVKRHASNIYKKLGVNNRRQAAIRARDLGILPPPNATD
jgi:LuxR family maltose regulon positive regulatory protein